MEMPFMSPPEFSTGRAPESLEGPGDWFVFQGDRLLVEMGPPTPAPDDPRIGSRPAWARLALQKRNIDPKILGFSPERALYIGSLQGTPCFAVEAPKDAHAPQGYGWAGLRSLFTVLPDAHFALAGRAIQLIDWDRTHRFCGRCGTPTEAKPEEHARVCPACKLSVYPRIAPAVMALVRQERRVLLGRSPHFPPGMFSALAGFVEPGETLEQCVARELEEEVGVQVSQIRYFASQPWPFPHSLMIAFVCDWHSGDIRPREGEIEDAQWFDVLQLPKLPSRISIARRLIDAVTGEMKAQLA
ncbi:MAG TPA: NAD(+) diphosphatase [Burkholderiales bacterium]|nr:NAD(+) diphosphatase [Burkholderiales bacterium]